MSLLEKVTRSNFFIRLASWEYWPFGVVQFPLFVYFIWLALRARSLTFFAASNPGIVMGGMFGESKFDVLQKIPGRYVPRTIRVEIPTTAEAVVERMKQKGLTFPVIFKPDLGERGFMVKRISSAEEARQYIAKTRADFLVQQLVDLPLEFGIFYKRMPGQDAGAVVSVVMKEMLSVTGDGKATLRELILASDRAKLQWRKLREAYANRLDEVIPRGQTLELVSIGNHALGTKFLDGNHLIDEKLSRTFDHISGQIDGFYFGRFDLRCATIEDLYEGRVMIVELNGCGAEPAHIYDPAFPLHKAIRVLFRHWKNIFLIAESNRRLGAKFPSLKEGIAYYKKFKAATQPG